MARTANATWKLRRLLAMSPSEVATRAMRSVAARLRRAESPVPQEEIAPPGTLVIDETGDAASEEWLRERLLRDRGMLLGGARDPKRLAAALGGIGVSVDATVAAADRIMAGSVPAFGWTSIETGLEPDWLDDPASHKRWPVVYWSNVDYRSDETFGDPRYVWEVNRQHHLVTLARAHLLTGDVRYAERVWRDMTSWIEQNPPLFGVNWASPLELAIRLISWSMAIDILGPVGAREGDVQSVALSVALQSAHVSDNLSTYASSRNNHLIGEAAGLLVAGAKFPFLKSASMLAGKGHAILERELSAQVTSDGVDREQTFQYEAFVLEFAAAALAAAGRLDTPFSPGFCDIVSGMCAFVRAVSGPDCAEPPAVGDGDGGRVYQLSDRPGHQAIEAAAAASAWCADRSFACSEADLGPAVWFLGEPARPGEGKEGKTELLDAGERSSFFPEGGYFVPAVDGQHGVIDCGPLGYLTIAAHGHADCLSLTVCRKGRWILVDPGTYCYHREESWRDYFRSTMAHNTVSVDGASQSEMLGPFMWGRQARASQRIWAPSERFDFFEGAHDGYRRFGGVVHRRSVVFVKRGYWVIVDRIEGRGHHQVSSVLQLARGFSKDEGEALAFSSPEAGKVEFWTWLPKGMKTGVEEGRTTPPAGWVSSGFGEKVESPALVAEGVVELPALMVAVVAPSETGSNFTVSCPGGASPGGTEIVVASPEGSDRILLGSPETAASGETFSGALGFVARDAEGVVRAGIAVCEWNEGGSAAEFVEIPNLLGTGQRGQVRL